MIQAVSGEIRKQSRQAARNTGTDEVVWRTEYIGTRASKIEDRPQAFLAEMEPNSTILPHFHQIDQYQVFVAGGGKLGRNAVPLLALHYVDHHTAYGPITASACGLSFFTIRAQSDPGSIYLHNPGYKDLLKPTKKRYLLAENIALSSEPALQYRSAVSQDDLFEETDGSDGLGAFMLRMGAGMKSIGPDPKVTGGQYYLIVNGSLELEGAGYPPLSLIYVGAVDAPLEACAGPEGLEALILSFPRWNCD